MFNSSEQKHLGAGSRGAEGFPKPLIKEESLNHMDVDIYVDVGIDINIDMA